jgi:hypothetical protein
MAISTVAVKSSASLFVLNPRYLKRTDIATIVQSTDRDQAMVDWLLVVRLAEIDAIRWALGGALWIWFPREHSEGAEVRASPLGGVS